MKEKLLEQIKEKLDSIRKIEDEIREVRKLLANESPFSIGSELEANGWTHNGKVFVVDSIYVAYGNCNAWQNRISDVPIFFIAEGFIKKKDGSLGKQRATRGLKIIED